MLIFKQTTKTAKNVIDEVAITLRDSENNIWSEEEMLQALQDTIEDLYPDVLLPLVDTSLETSNGIFEYTIPADFESIEKVSVKFPLDDVYAQVGFYIKNTITGGTIVLRKFEEGGGTIELVGGKRIPTPTSETSALEYSFETDKVVRIGMRLELYKTVLLDKSKMNQLSARETETTEVDVMNVIDRIEKEYTKRKEHLATSFITQLNRI